jgi:PAS domain S-box-containing protein
MSAPARITEALMREALRGSGTTVWEWDVRNDRLSSTDESAALLGYPPGEIADDQGAWNALIHPDDLAANHDAYLRHARGETPLYEHEYRALGKDGAWRWLIERGRVVERDPLGNPLRVVGVLSDITDRRALLEARTAALSAQAANRAKTDFLSRMSHELRTPLNAVLGFAQLLEIDEREPLGETQRHRVALIREAGSHLLAMIGELLDLTRIEAGQLSVRLTALPLAALIRDSVELVRPQAEAAGVSLGEIGRAHV